MSNIVGVQFQDKRNPDEFRGREYSYFAEIDLKIGDIVIVPTSGGEEIARVSSVDIPESKVDERILPALKTIERRYETESDIKEGVVACQQQ